MNICVMTDDLSADPYAAMELAQSFGITRMMIRTVTSRSAPFFSQDDLLYFERMRRESDWTVEAIMPGAHRVGEEQTSWDQLKQSGFGELLQVAQELLCRTIIVFGGSSFLPKQEQYVAAENLNRLLVRTHAKGWTLAVQNSPGTCFESEKEIMEWIMMQRAPVKVSLNPSAFALAGMDWEQEMEPLMPYTCNIMLKDYELKKNGDAVFVPFGAGEINAPRLCRFLQEQKYQGNLTVDANCPNAREAFVDTVQVLKKYDLLG